VARSKPSEQIDALTGIRGFAALWVAAFHGHGTLTPNIQLPLFLENLIDSGWLAVDLFFVLSGFVISYVHLRDFPTVSMENTKRFLALRIARIYPAHACVALLWVPIVAAVWLSKLPGSYGMDQQFNTRTFVHAMTLTNGWGFPDSVGWNLPSWSVGSEWFAYLTFPLLAYVLLRLPTLGGQVAIAATSILVPTTLALSHYGLSKYMLPESFTLLRVESEFLVGCCAYGISRRLPARFPVAWMPWAGVGGCAVLACTGEHGLGDGLYIPVFGLVVLGLATATGGVLARILASGASVYLGKISYSIYLMHGLIITILRKVPGILQGFGPKHPAFVWAIYLASVVLAGAALYKCVEEPARRYLRRRWLSRPGKGS
jgi:peptidoglycan/LPS O-acetylase OafA/YrhL